MGETPSPPDIYLAMVDEERDVYQLAELFPQLRRAPDHYLPHVTCVACRSPLAEAANALSCKACGASYPLDDGVLDLRPSRKGTTSWDRLNEQFLNYHRSLTVHTLLCSTPIINYVSRRSGLREARGLRVLDVGGGTGQMLCSFFQHPETLDYYLLDPNLRLLHDQFIRIYPELLTTPMTHLLGVAERLAFVDGTFDLVLSYSAIDHYEDYRAFLKESFRVLRPGGRILVSSHLDAKGASARGGRKARKLLTLAAFESIGRRLFYRKHRVGSDDHTFHFASAAPVVEAMTGAGFRTHVVEEFKGHFFVLAEKPE